MTILARPEAGRRWADALKAMWSAPAVTLVGANETAGTTRLILDSLEHPDARFAGAVNIVNRRGGEVYGYPVHTSVAAVQGEVGLLWLLVRADLVLPTLEELGDRRPHGVVVFADGFRDPGLEGTEKRIVAWANERGVPLFGPQSVGVASFAQGFNALDLPVGLPPQPGSVAVVSQSGGLLCVLLREMRRTGVGVHSAFSVGTGAMLDSFDLVEGLLEDDAVGAVALYQEGLGSVARFARLAHQAAERGKPLCLLLGGRSETGATLAASHTGALATPQRLVRGVCQQYGVVVVDDPDDLVAALSALQSTGFKRLANPDVGVFTGTGGGAIILADVLEQQGIPLVEPSAEFVASLAADKGVHLVSANPLDLGAGLIGRRDHYREMVSGFVSDASFGVGVNIVPFTPTEADPPSFAWQMEEAIKVTHEAGRHAVVSLLHKDATRVPERGGVTFGYGIRDTVVKLKALRIWSLGSPGPRPATPAPGAAAGTRVASAEETRELLGSVPLAWPNEWVVGTGISSAEAVEAVTFPVVAKAETGSAHRAKEGAVVTTVPDARAGAAVVDYLRSLFGVAVTLSEFVEHTEEFFVGLSRDEEGAVAIALGPGGSGVEDMDVGVRLLPMGDQQLSAVLLRYLPSLADDSPVREVVAALEKVMADPRVESIDINPVVRGVDGVLTALDAKVHVYR